MRKYITNLHEETLTTFESGPKMTTEQMNRALAKFPFLFAVSNRWLAPGTNIVYEPWGSWGSVRFPLSQGSYPDDADKLWAGPERWLGDLDHVWIHNNSER